MLRAAGVFIVLSATVVSVLCLTAGEIDAEKRGWSPTSNTQYHIQTDEGPERSFGFQTPNGQYQMQKRLENGMVVGVDAWIDDNGDLHKTDYMADQNGYRILEFKQMHVGRNQPIKDAIALSKTVSAQSGSSVKPRRPANPFRKPPAIQDPSSNSVESSTVTPYRAYSPVTRRYKIGTTTPNPTTNYYSSTIDPRPILIEDSRANPPPNYLQPAYSFQSPSETPYHTPYPDNYRPSVDIQPPTFESNKDLRTSQSLDVQVSPESSYGLYRHNRKSIDNNNGVPVVTSINNNYKSTANVQRYRGSTKYHTGNRGSNHNNDRGSISYPNKRIDVPDSPSSPKTPEYKLPPYNGHHTTADGFLYNAESHYHEEEKEPKSDTVIGSYGYVDPLGIRRVVYYKADPDNGLVYKQNNRYVGHDATPYDPLPLNS